MYLLDAIFSTSLCVFPSNNGEQSVALLPSIILQYPPKYPVLPWVSNLWTPRQDLLKSSRLPRTTPCSYLSVVPPTLNWQSSTLPECPTLIPSPVSSNLNLLRIASPQQQTFTVHIVIISPQILDCCLSLAASAVTCEDIRKVPDRFLTQVESEVTREHIR